MTGGMFRFDSMFYHVAYTTFSESAGAFWVLLFFLTAAGLTKQVSLCGHWSCRGDSFGCWPDSDEGVAVAEAEQDGHLVSTKQPHAADVCIKGKNRQDAASLQVPKA